MTTDDLSTLTYDEALREIESILTRLQSQPPLPIDQVIAESRRAAALIQHCKGKIAAVSKEVDEILNDLRDNDAAPTL